jgi:phosphate transport system substrate-binding protein
MCGSNTVGTELAPAIVEAFLKKKGAANVRRTTHGETTSLVADLSGAALVVELSARGTATAFEGLAAGTCDVGMASRPINEKEASKLASAGLGDLRSPASEHVIALDGIAVVVNPNNAVRSLDRQALHDIFTGAVADWSAVGGTPGPIVVVARDKQSGTYDTFKNLVLGSDDVVPAAKRFAQSDELSDAVASNPAAIGFIGLAYTRSARAVAVGERGALPMLPTTFTVTTESYMLSRRLFFYSTAKPRTPLVAELVSFALSNDGQAAVRTTSFVDLSVALRDAPACDARCPRRYADLTSQARRVSLDFRFKPGTSDLDSRAARDLDRIVQFMRTQPDKQITLFGFSDGSGDAASNVRLSQARAQAVSRELAMRGVRVGAVEGFGAAMPVASSATDPDRERNRRVEVWLR